ncbi:hypothetical protein [Bacteroides faecalis]|nr:hypothetical protein [Bacteroides faecalis]
MENRLFAIGSSPSFHPEFWKIAVHKCFTAIIRINAHHYRYLETPVYYD